MYLTHFMHYAAGNCTVGHANHNPGLPFLPPSHARSPLSSIVGLTPPENATRKCRCPATYKNGPKLPKSAREALAKMLQGGQALVLVYKVVLPTSGDPRTIEIFLLLQSSAPPEELACESSYPLLLHS